VFSPVHLHNVLRTEGHHGLDSRDSRPLLLSRLVFFFLIIYFLCIQSSVRAYFERLDGFLEVCVGTCSLVLVEEHVLRSIEAHDSALNKTLFVILQVHERLVGLHHVLQIIRSVFREPLLHRESSRLVKERPHQSGIEVQRVVTHVVVVGVQVFNRKVRPFGELLSRLRVPDANHKKLDVVCVELRLHVSSQFHSKLPAQRSPKMSAEGHEDALVRRPQVSQFHLGAVRYSEHLAVLKSSVKGTLLAASRVQSRVRFRDSARV